MVKKVVGVVFSNQPSFPKLCYSLSSLGYTIRIVCPDEKRDDLDLLVIHTDANYLESIPIGNIPGYTSTDNFIYEFVKNETVEYYVDRSIPILVLNQAVLYCRNLFGGYICDIKDNHKKGNITIDDTIVGEYLSMYVDIPTQILKIDSGFHFIKSEEHTLGLVSDKNPNIMGIHLSLDDSLLFLDKVIEYYLPLEDQLNEDPGEGSAFKVPACVPKN